MNCTNVGMVQGRSGLCFTAKAAQDLSIFGHFVGQKLQRNKAIEFGVLGFEYYAHPATAQLLDDAIVQDGLADHGRRLSPEHILRTGSRRVNVLAVLGEAHRAVRLFAGGGRTLLENDFDAADSWMRSRLDGMAGNDGDRSLAR